VSDTQKGRRRRRRPFCATIRSTGSMKKRKSKKKWRLVPFLFFALLCIGILFYGIYYFTNLERWQITLVQSEGNSTVKGADIIEVAEGELEGRYLWLIPRRFLYMYPKENIEEAVKQIDKVKTVTSGRNGNSVVVKIEEFVPYALWCHEDCWFMDNEGVAFVKAPNLEGASLIRFVNVAASPEKLAVFAPEQEMLYIRLWVNYLDKKYDWVVDKVEKDGNEVTFHLRGDGYIKTSQQSKPTTGMKNLETILNSEEFAHLDPSDFDYIDLRYKNKVFVKEERVLDETITGNEVRLETAE